MPTQIQFRRGTTAQNDVFTGAVGEISIDTQKNTIRVHNGIAQGGTELLNFQKFNQTLTTANVVELNNLYFTEARTRTSVSAEGSINYNNTTGVFSFTQGNTDTVVEGVSNLFYSNSRVDAYINESITTTDVSEGDNLYYTLSRSNTAIDNRVTKAFVDNLGVDATTLDGIDSTAFALDTDLTTANVTEATNLYFTFDRARSALVSNTVSIGELTVTGNLFVEGDTVQINTATLTVEDKNILIANGAATAEVADGAGITVAGADATITYVFNGDVWRFNKGANVQGEISATGTITSPFFYSESDATLKENITPIENALDIVNAINGVKFTWKRSQAPGVGVIAQEVSAVLPEVVSTNPSGSLTVSYDSLVAVLIEAVKEQQIQIEELKAKIK